MSTTSILMLPDCLADSRLLESQRTKFPNMRTADWLDAQEHESLVEYAERCAQQWVVGANSLIDCQQPYVLGGVFFGGIIALEMAFHLSRIERAPSAVLLISSCRTWDALPTAFDGRVRWLNRLPSSARSWLLYRATVGRVARSENLNTQQIRLLKSMLGQQDWQWLLRSAAMCKGWRRDNCDVARATFPVHQIHGRIDKLISPPSAKVATLLLDGGHFICLTHAAAVNNWIEAILCELELRHTGARIATNGPQ